MSFDSLDDSASGMDKELKEFLALEQKKAQFQSQVLNFQEPVFYINDLLHQ